MWLFVLSDQLPIVALVGSYPTNQLIGHRPIPKHPSLARKALLAPFQQSEPMRACRRFLAGIPHLGPGHPCITHPSATPSCSEKHQDVRLACVRHAASVYPEPGSNSPSVRFICCLLYAHRAKGANSFFVRFVSRDPGQAAVILFTLGCSQIHCCLCARSL